MCVEVGTGVEVDVLVAASAVSADDAAASSSGEGPQAEIKNKQKITKTNNKSILLYLDITYLLFIFCEYGETSNELIKQ
jgi:hypothetical protein